MNNFEILATLFGLSTTCWILYFIHRIFQLQASIDAFKNIMREIDLDVSLSKGYKLGEIGGLYYIECHTCHLKSYNKDHIIKAYCDNCKKYHV